MNKTFLLTKIKQPSTWLGLLTLAAGAGYSLTPELKDVIVQVGSGIGALLLILVKESGETKK